MNPIQLYSGEAAFTLLDSPSFQSAWEKLYQDCPWATGFQAPVYVRTWYRVYTGEFTPVLLAAFKSPDSLHGLLALAVTLDCRRLFAAADRQAEYQTWIASPSYGEMFMPQALKLLRQHYPSLKLQLRYLPPNTPLSWLNNEQHAEKRRCMLLTARDPIWMLSDGDGSSKHKKLRNRLNNLRKLGEIKFSRIATKEEFSAMLEQFIPLFDFRQGAAYQKMPFHNNTRKKTFFLELFAAQPDFFHASTLTLNGKLIGGIIGVTGHRTVHLGELGHSPFFSKYSLGNLHLWLLIQQLMVEGFYIFDLTPGDDPYKDRFCTSKRTVYVLDVYCNQIQCSLCKAKLKFKKTVQNRLKFLPDQGVLLKVQLRKLIVKLLRICTISHDDNHKLKSKWYQRKITSKDVIDITADISISVNKLEDILFYHPVKGGKKAYYAYLSACMSRIMRGGQCYTRLAEGRLIEAGWLYPTLDVESTSCGKVLPPAAMWLEWDTALGSELRLLPYLLSAALQNGAQSVCLRLNNDQVALQKQIVQEGFVPMLWEVAA